MSINILLPSLSAGMEDAIIARWLKSEGDLVARGDVLAEVETDKATMEIEAEGDGRLGRWLVAAGVRAKVNDVLAVLLAEGESEDAAVPASAKQAVSAADGAAATQTLSKPAINEERRHFASPLARRVAAEHGVALDMINGSGPRGRIVRRDVERAAFTAPAALLAPPAAPVAATDAVAAAVLPNIISQPSLDGFGPYEAVPHSGMRRTIARRLLASKTTVPHFYLDIDINLDALLALRVEINNGQTAADKLSINDFVIKAAALALRKVPEANVVWTEEALLRLGSVDIAVAVATPGGLLTPILREADKCSIGALSAAMRVLAARARAGKLRPDEYQGGGFSISNLGMYGVKSFTAIVNPPQSAILAVGAADRRPIGRGDEIVLASMMSCTLSVDHRSVDGAVGAEWLAAFRRGIEAPLSLLI